MKGKCPNCGKPVLVQDYLPFCSDRCRLIDLGDWLTGNYRIADKEETGPFPEKVPYDTRH
jgi:hypothetical protein